jgi:hypothetical protein
MFSARARTGDVKQGERHRQSPVEEVIGWRELVGLPDFNIASLRAKIDTGARTSALHAEDQMIFERDGEKWVRFSFPREGKSADRLLEARVFDEREIKNTGGVPERRLIVRTTLVLGRHRWKIEVSLADRKKMEFDLILGRTAIRRHRIWVDPGRSYIVGPPLAKRGKVRKRLPEGVLRTLK